MVQRKVTNKLGIQADHVNTSEQLLGNLKKPTSSQHHQDGKNRGGPDMKKKMKRSRSTKSIETLKSLPLRTTISQPGKSRPLDSPATAAGTTPRMKSVITGKAKGSSPNYMKSTSSSEARKERLLVCSLNTDQSGKNLHRSSNGNLKVKQQKSLTRTSSLEMVRTLTKSPSFKPVRGTTKKCSRVSLCSDYVKVQRATCSSILKDSKFPDFLMLNPGGSEAEGTSAMRVCPYTYCSLNGHHHNPLPPLKCFLKARRRSLKVQKCAKLEVLSPHGAKPIDDGTEGIDRRNPGFDEVHEIGTDFFIEIYGGKSDDGAEATEEYTDKEPEKQNDESCSCNGNNSIDLAEMVNKGEFDEEQQLEDVVDEEESSVWPGEVATAESFARGSDIDVEFQASTEGYDSISEATDMEWKEGGVPGAEYVTEADYFGKLDDDSHTNKDYLSVFKKPDSRDNTEIMGSDDDVSTFTEEIQADDEWNDNKNELYGMERSLEILEFAQVTCGVNYHQVYVSENESEEGKEDATDLIDVVPTSAFMVKPTIIEVCDSVETVLETIPQFGDAQSDCTSDMLAEVLNSHHEDLSLQNQIADSSEDFAEKDEIETDEEINKNLKSKDNGGDQDFSITYSMPEQELSTDTEAGDGIEYRDQVASIEVFSGIRIFDTSKSFSNEDCQEHNDIVEESQDFADCSGTEGPKIRELKEDHDESNKLKIPTSKDSNDSSDSRVYELSLTGINEAEVEEMEVELSTKSGISETFLKPNKETSFESECTILNPGSNFNQEVSTLCNNKKWTMRCKKPMNLTEEHRKFNPKEPNFLPVVPDPESENVDLRHQMMDDRKNEEEWMLDYALRQAVNKLAPARKRKVALLVEAFETVSPIPKYEPQIRHSPAAFSPRPIQACN